MNTSDTKKRIAVLGMHLESNAFAPVCGQESFHTLCYLSGNEILADLKSETPKQPVEISGFVSEMNRLGVAWEPVPIVVTASEPNGPCDQAFFDATLIEMRSRLNEAGPVDGVYVSAHGGMTATVSPGPTPRPPSPRPPSPRPPNPRRASPRRATTSGSSTPMS